MTHEQFAYWLQGFTELTPDMPVPSPAQWQAIKDHLATVFVKVTPAYQPPSIGFPGVIRTQEVRPEDRLAEYMNKHHSIWPNGGAPVITC